MPFFSIYSLNQFKWHVLNSGCVHRFIDTVVYIEIDKLELNVWCFRRLQLLSHTITRKLYTHNTILRYFSLPEVTN